MEISFWDDIGNRDGWNLVSFFSLDSTLKWYLEKRRKISLSLIVKLKRLNPCSQSTEQLQPFGFIPRSIWTPICRRTGDLRFLQRYFRRVKSTGMLRRVDWKILTEVQKDRFAFIFRVSQSKTNAWTGWAWGWN